MSKSGQVTVCPRRTRGKAKRTRELEAETVAVLDTFDGVMSTRQVYYQLVSRAAVPNRAAAYNQVQRLLVNMRREGLIPHHRIVDRTRSKHQLASWDGTRAVLDAAAKQYRRNLWADQDIVVMVACEKQALEGVFAEVCDEYGASLWVLRGFASVAFIFEWASEVQRLTEGGHRVVIAYFGDFDPSGLAIETACQAALREHGAVFDWARVGLLSADFEAFGLINVPVKATDSRARAYLAKYGDRAAELDALPPAELQGRIRGTILEHLDVEAWNRLAEVEHEERESMRRVMGDWARALAAVEGT